VNGRPLPEHEELMTPAEVRVLFRIDPKTLQRWARAGMLSSVRTPGNHRRYKRAEVMALLRESGGSR
jgi:excisionase family DNA binding protein